MSLKGNPLEKCKGASPIFLVWQHRAGTESTLSLCRLGIQPLGSHLCSLHKKGQTQGNHRVGSCHQPQQVRVRVSMIDSAVTLLRKWESAVLEVVCYRVSRPSEIWHGRRIAACPVLTFQMQLCDLVCVVNFLPPLFCRVERDILDCV